MSTCIYIIAGEPSGDLLGARLMRALREQHPEVCFAGIGGEVMQSEGLSTLFPIAEISVMGLFEVIPRLRNILRRIDETVKDIERLQPNAIVTIDSWGFVSSVLKRLKKRGCKIPKIHYVAPQVWAWKKGRAKKVPKLVDHLMTLLPYEPAYFEKYGLACTFVGHSVIETANQTRLTRTEFAKKYQLCEEKDRLNLCILCGSRQSEVHRLAPIFVKAIQIIAKKYPNIHLILPTVKVLSSQVEQHFAPLQIPYTIVQGSERYSAFSASDFALAASGTVSLELTSCDTPHLIAYTFNKLTNALTHILVKIKFANLINILADKEIIPEFTIEKCKAEYIAQKALEMINDKTALQTQMIEAKAQFAKLQPSNLLPSQTAANTVWNIIVRKD
ncbi:MAG: lipid-A-disaccharide synthase [Bacteroidales bacterium]